MSFRLLPSKLQSEHPSLLTGPALPPSSQSFPPHQKDRFLTTSVVERRAASTRLGGERQALSSRVTPAGTPGERPGRCSPALSAARCTVLLSGGFRNVTRSFPAAFLQLPLLPDFENLNILPAASAVFVCFNQTLSFLPSPKPGFSPHVFLNVFVTQFSLVFTSTCLTS